MGRANHRRAQALSFVLAAAAVAPPGIGPQWGWDTCTPIPVLRTSTAGCLCGQACHLQGRPLAALLLSVVLQSALRADLLTSLS